MIFLAEFARPIAGILAIAVAFWVFFNWPKWTYGYLKPDGTWRTKAEMDDEYWKRMSKLGLIGTLLGICFLIAFFIFIFNKIFGVE